MGEAINMNFLNGSIYVRYLLKNESPSQKPVQNNQQILKPPSLISTILGKDTGKTSQTKKYYYHSSTLY